MSPSLKSGSGSSSESFRFDINWLNSSSELSFSKLFNALFVANSKSNNARAGSSTLVFATERGRRLSKRLLPRVRHHLGFHRLVFHRAHAVPAVAFANP